MKIRRKRILKPLIQLYFLKNQFYKQFITFKNINTVILELKQALKILFLYNKKKKNILFIGFYYNKFIQNQLNHSFSSKNLYSETKLKINKFDLIVFNKTSVNDLKLIKKLKKLNIPIIIFGGLNKIGYDVSTSFNKKNLKTFNSYILFSVLTKYNK